MKLQILTPDKSVFDGDVESIQIPGTTGPFQILKDHAPILSSLVPGILTIKIGIKESLYSIAGGFIEFHSNNAVILADAVETPEEIDVKRLEKAKQKATDALTNPAVAAFNKSEAKQAFARAKARIKLVEITKA